MTSLLCSALATFWKPSNHRFIREFNEIFVPSKITLILCKKGFNNRTRNIIRSKHGNFSWTENKNAPNCAWENPSKFWQYICLKVNVIYVYFCEEWKLFFVWIKNTLYRTVWKKIFLNLPKLKRFLWSIKVQNILNFALHLFLIYLY